MMQEWLPTDLSSLFLELWCGLLAEVRLSELPPEFQATSTNDPDRFWMLLNGGVLSIVLIGGGLWARWQWPPCRNEEDRLWRNLCRTHGLTAFQRDTVAWITRRAGLPHPAWLLMTREAYDEALATANLRRWQRLFHRRRLAAIRDKLFSA